jgi:nucleoid-associated protein YgaU
VTEKALEGKPPLPPAVAKPVESGPVVEAMSPAAPEKPLSKPVILLSSAEAPKAPKGPTACPSCGEAVEPGWKRCPNCTAPLEPAAAGGEPAKAQTPASAGPFHAATKPEAAPAQAARAAQAGDAAPKAPSAENEHAAAEKEIREVESELEKMEKNGQNVAHARNLLKLAISFLRGGSYEKATRYARKVKNVLEEKKTG